jgi:ABC-type sugar transport system substrate-binding protein
MSYKNRRNLICCLQLNTVIFKHLLPPGQVMLATAPTIRVLRDKLRSFSDSDFLLAIGDPMAIGMSVAIAAGFNSGKIKMLKWDRQEHRYYALEADLTGVRNA